MKPFNPQDHDNLFVRLGGFLAKVAGSRPSPDAPLPSDAEPHWSRWLANQLGGQPEFSLFDRSRVDILTDELAIEVEWCDRNKVVEAVAQSTKYAVATGRKPAILLLTGRDAVSVEKAAYREFLAHAIEHRIHAVAVLNVTQPSIKETKVTLGYP